MTAGAFRFSHNPEIEAPRIGGTALLIGRTSDYHRRLAVPPRGLTLFICPSRRE
jgi:hypothetical protein